MPEIGATLREARMRARIDVSEIEAQTKIRAKYLRALENEEWDLLPGPTFVKSFLRTYAQALDLDGKALVEEYKLTFEHPGEGERAEFGGQQPAVSATHRARQRSSAAQARRGVGGAAGPRQGPSRGYLAAVGVVGVLIVLLLVGLLTSGGGSTNTNAGSPSRHIGTSGRGSKGKRHLPVRSAPRLASLKVEPTGEVYVCLIGDGGRKRIPGLILKPGAAEPEYHARRFEITLGNNALTLVVDGAPHTVPASSQAIGYSITRAGLSPLAAGELPTCK
jgi:helix-turn-helix protein